MQVPFCEMSMTVYVPGAVYVADVLMFAVVVVEVPLPKLHTEVMLELSKVLEELLVNTTSSGAYPFCGLGVKSLSKPPVVTLNMPVTWHPVSVFETRNWYNPGRETLTLFEGVPLRSGLIFDTGAAVGLNAAPVGYRKYQYISPVLDPTMEVSKVACVPPQSTVPVETGLVRTGNCDLSITFIVAVVVHPL
jgi:hypothetical protein